MDQRKIFPDVQALTYSAAASFISLASQAIQSRGRFSVALSGGSTPLLMYSLLATDPYRELVDWSRIHFFWSDERCVPPDHPDSNYLSAWEALLSKVPLLPSQIHRIQAELSPELASERYETELKNYFASGPAASEGTISSFDLVLLGIGEDGHTASLFPGSDVLQEQKHWVKEVYVNQLKTWRITLTLPIINQAAQVIVLAAGASKSTALKEIWYGKFRPELFPAQMVRPLNDNLHWMVDEAAAQVMKTQPDPVQVRQSWNPKLLISGFEPFGGSSINPSEKILSSLSEVSLEDARLIPVLLPVDHLRGPEVLLDAVKTYQPDAVVCLGEASGRAVISIERIAINLLDFRIPDNRGAKVVDEAIVPDGPAAYFATLPVRKIFQAITQAGIPAELSLSAGAFLCNQVLYQLLHHLSMSPKHVPAGFIHLPSLPEQVVEKPNIVPSMSLETTRKAIRIIIDTIRQELSTNRESPN